MLDTSLCCNELENPIGIETIPPGSGGSSPALGCNELENPIGIETLKGTYWIELDTRVATNLKTR